jgi:uncharacterized protein (DUF427 family)
VWSFPRPPAVEQEGARVRISHAGDHLAETTSAWRVLETSHPPVYYLPPEDVATSRLVQSGSTSFCEFKGVARYWHVRLGDDLLRDVAWGYPDPSPGYEAITGHLAFYAGPFDSCTVGDEQVTPQPGGFYGGWVTSAYTGPFKGEPGTTGW